MKKIRIITAFPEFFVSPFNTSMFKKAQDKHIIFFEVHDLRNYSADRHRTVDDKPYGGGPGMVFKPEPLYNAIGHIKEKTSKTLFIYFSPKGSLLTPHLVKRYVNLSDITLICGHYEGIDQRIIDNLIDDEISVGDYILTGGEIASLVFIDVLIRYIPGVLGNMSSLENESFENSLLDYPHYTRPSEFRGCKVPDVLISGNHKEIDEWRIRQSKEITSRRRPDLLKNGKI